MPYDINARLRQANPVGAFIDARDNAMQNALVQRRQMLDEQSQAADMENALFQRERLQAADARVQQQDQAAAERADDERFHAYLQQLDASKDNPQKYQYLVNGIVNSPLGRKHGITPDILSPDQVPSLLAQSAAELGIGPSVEKGPQIGAVQPGSYTPESVARFNQTGNYADLVRYEEPQKTTVAQRARTLGPDEVRAKGFPEGSVVQELPDGRLDVVNKRETLSAAEQKTIRDAKMRMPRVNATLRRVERLGKAVESIAKNKLYDGGPADAKVLQYTDQGRELMAASAQLMPELQALTRVPGIGSQSDLEARLAALALPSLEMPPEANRRSQEELRAFIQDLKAAYESIVSGEPVQPAPAPTPAQPAQKPITATGPNGQKLMLQNGQWVPMNGR